MKKIINEWKGFLTESSISRTYEHILNHDTAFITAFRDNAKDTTKCMPDHSKTLENFERNRQLKAVLFNKGYGVTKVAGTYVEDFGTEAAKEVKEDSFFVVNLKDDPNFKDTMASLSEHFCQDSFLYVPLGGEDSFFVVNLKDDPRFKDVMAGLSEHFCQDSFLYVPLGGEDSFLVGTNRAEFPGYGNEEKMGSFHGGVESEFMTRVGKSKRPIKFEEGLETKAKMQNNTKFLISRLAKQVIKEMKENI